MLSDNQNIFNCSPVQKEREIVTEIFKSNFEEILSSVELWILSILDSLVKHFFFRRGHRRNASEYLPDSAHYRAGYSYQDRENRFQDAATRNYDLQQGSSAPQPSGGPPRYTSNPNLAAEVNPEYERPPPYYYPGATPAGAGATAAGASSAEMPLNRS